MASNPSNPAYLEIPIRYSSLLKTKQIEKLDEIKKRKRTISSLISSQTSVDDFVLLKIQTLEADLEYGRRQREYFRDALQQGIMNEEQHSEVTEDIETATEPIEEEIVQLKRQKRFLVDDLREKQEDDEYADNLEKAFQDLSSSRAMSASKLKKAKPFNAGEFRQEVLNYYDGLRPSDDGSSHQVFCQMTGWTEPGDTVRAAYIVPKSYEGTVLSYFFGVGDALLKAPNDALLLYAPIEKAMDSGLIVFVPEISGSKREVRWKLVLTDKKMAKSNLFSRPGNFPKMVRIGGQIS
jgi:hypothetical protein